MIKKINSKLCLNKKIGLMFALIFFLIASQKYFHIKIISLEVAILLAISALFCVVVILNLSILNQFRRGWFFFGGILGRIVSPLVLGLIFFTIITPSATLTRWFGRDQLKIKKSKNKSFWVKPSKKILDPDSFKNQF